MAEENKINLPTGVKHSKPSIVKFRHRGRTIDLRTVTHARVLQLAKDKDCKVLEHTAQEVKKQTPAKDTK
jgi:hypothetical protein